MGLEVGNVLEAKVTGITKFGAFVSLPDGKSGLVHISEIANTYVSDVHEHLQIGQEVKVKVLNMTEDGKINLSIKRAQEPQNREGAQQGRFNRRPVQRDNYTPRTQSAPRTQNSQRAQAAPEGRVNAPGSDQQFEERLKKFMQESDSRIASNPMYSDHKKRNRRR